MSKLTNPQIGTISNAIKKFYLNADQENIAGMRVYVVPKFVTYDEDQPGYFKALVQLEVDYVKSRKQKMHICFKLDSKSELDPLSLHYL
jgi:hypothetical protein